MTKQTMSEELSLKIGFLRQWLNEDRISDPKKLVTNEDILHWIGEAIEESGKDSYAAGAKSIKGTFEQVRIDTLVEVKEAIMRGEYGHSELSIVRELEDRITKLNAQLKKEG